MAPGQIRDIAPSLAPPCAGVARAQPLGHAFLDQPRDPLSQLQLWTGLQRCSTPRRSINARWRSPSPLYVEQEGHAESRESLRERLAGVAFAEPDVRHRGVRPDARLEASLDPKASGVPSHPSARRRAW